jgi:hypothetical protein
MTLFGLGASYANARSFVMGEWISTRTDSVFGDVTAWYLSGGHRWGSFTPYVTYARSNRASHRTVRGLTVEAFPPALAGMVAGLNGALNDMRSSAPDQRTTSLGVRWDVVRNVDVKLQYDRVDVEKGSTGTFGNLMPGHRPDGANLFSLAVDFVF